MESGDKIKRLKDDSDEDEDEKVPVKLPKLDNPTDHLVEKKAPGEKAVWERSIGSLSSKKGGLGVLVKKKTPAVTGTTSKVISSPPADPPVSSPVVKTSNALGMLGNYSGSSDSTSE